MSSCPTRLVAALVVGLVLPHATHAAGRFIDGPEALGPRAAVERMADLGILPPDGPYFRPELQLNRYRLAIIIGRVLELLQAPPPMVQPPKMPDLREGHWAEVSARRAVAIGAMRAYKDGNFHGERMVDRYHLAVMYQGLRDLIWPLKTNKVMAPRPGDTKNHLWGDAAQLVVGEGYMSLPNGTCFLGKKKVDRLTLALFLDSILPPRFTGGHESPQDRGVPEGGMPAPVQTVITIPGIEFPEERPLLPPMGEPEPVSLRSAGLTEASTIGEVAPALMRVYAEGQAKARAELQAALEERLRENRKAMNYRVAESEAVMELRMDEIEFKQRMLDELEMERQTLYTVERAMETPHGLLVPSRRHPVDSWSEGW